VFDVGAIGLDNIERLDLLDRAALEADLGIPLTAPLALCTFHPETLSGSSAADGVAPLFAALTARPELRVVFTKGNADTGGRELNDLVDAFAATHADRITAFTSLGQLRYLSMMQVADVVVGNSSSGIVEAPAVGTPTVNIGDRQRGRLRAPSVIDCANDADAIGVALDTALSPAFQATASRRESPFHAPGASAAIAETVATHDLDGILHKRFTDVGGTP
jgi:UDP-hydrolysing UDP-N-acetyl-D-glucosamine 2-epimerase